MIRITNKNINPTKRLLEYIRIEKEFIEGMKNRYVLEEKHFGALLYYIYICYENQRLDSSVSSPRIAFGLQGESISKKESEERNNCTLNKYLKKDSYRYK